MSPPRAPPIHQLGIVGLFQALSPSEKKYAHHMSRAAWHGTRIILQQVSPESNDIFDFILGLYAACSGDWESLTDAGVISSDDLEGFLNYASAFLSNIGNYYGSGDQKFTPAMDSTALLGLSKLSPELGTLHGRLSNAIFSTPPYSLGYPGGSAQSAYYPGDNKISEDEVKRVSLLLEENGILPENTRIRKDSRDGSPLYEVLIASVAKADEEREFSLPGDGGKIRTVTGDHSEALSKICDSLTEAVKYASNDTQKRVLAQYIESFTTGSLDAYRESQKTWVSDKAPKVENILGFVEPYRDPHGTRSEFEGLVAIADAGETAILKRLVDSSDAFIRRLPWCDGCSLEDNNGKGPFEKALFDPPDFASIHTLAYCSSIIFPGINLPNYNDIRQEHGFKNVIVANRMTAEAAVSSDSGATAFVDPSELDAFQRHKFAAYYWWVVLHELLGHGTGKMMMRHADGSFNFDVGGGGKPPTNPLTGRPIECWYEPGQTWTGRFADLATTVDECRAELVGAYLMDDKELLGLLGFDESSEITADEITYNTYMQLGIDGLRGLANYNVETGTWGQAHSRAHFAILKCLLLTGGGAVTVTHTPSPAPGSLAVRVDRSKILSHGKPALGRMLMRLHMYRVTGDVDACRAYYADELTKVEGDDETMRWREAVLGVRRPRWVFVQANTFLVGDEVLLREYEPTTRGVMKSWAERDV